MTLIEVIRELGLENTDINITYRTTGIIWDGSQEDILAGFALWENGYLFSLDGDSYELDDEIDKYQLTEDSLIVWYESEWLTGEELNNILSSKRKSKKTR